jgi:hypothetical protein
MKKHLTIILIGSLVFLASGGQALARSSGKDKVLTVEEIKAKIAKLGTGKKAKAQIKLRTGEKIKGFVDSAGDDSFAFTERDTKQTKTIAYADVVEVKKAGGLSTGAKIAIGLGIGVGVLAIVAIYVKNHLFDDFKPFSQH